MPKKFSYIPSDKNYPLVLTEKGKEKYDDSNSYKSFLNTLPKNLSTETKDYNTKRGWELHGKPPTMQDAIESGWITKQDDGYHMSTVAYNKENDTYEFLKSKEHQTISKEFEWYNSSDANEFRKKYKLVEDQNGFKYVNNKNTKVSNTVDLSNTKINYDPKYRDAKQPEYSVENIPSQKEAIANYIKSNPTKFPKYFKALSEEKQKEAFNEVVREKPNHPMVKALMYEAAFGGAAPIAGLEYVSKIPGVKKALNYIGNKIKPSISNVNSISKFSPDPESYYRVIGNEEGYQDAITSGYIRPNQKGIFKDRNAYYTKGSVNDKSNPVIGSGVKKGTYYNGEYIVEVKPGKYYPDKADNLPQFNFGKTSSDNHIPISEENVRILKRDSKLGYKEVPKNNNHTLVNKENIVNEYLDSFNELKDILLLKNIKSESGENWIKNWYKSPVTKNKASLVNNNMLHQKSGLEFGDLKMQLANRELSQYIPKTYKDLYKDEGVKIYARLVPFTSGVSMGSPDKIYVRKTPLSFLNKLEVESTRVHELTHLTELNGERLRKVEEDMLLEPFGHTSETISGIKKKSKDAYYLDPTEIHARMNEARFNLNKNPEDIFTIEDYNKIKSKNNFNGMGRYIKDRDKFIKLMNTFYSTGAVITGSSIGLNKIKNGKSK